MLSLVFFGIFVLSSGSLLGSSSALALDLDWSGQFRTESHWIYNYTLQRGASPKAPSSNLTGYKVPSGGENNAFFQTLFMRVNPVVVVNDNVYIKSEWWVGDPIFGFFGDAAGKTADQRTYFGSYSNGSTIRAQRFWGEFLTDFGTVQVGRAPINWGLGLFWNSGDSVYSRYHSTGDVIRMISKFGSFTFTPGVHKYSIGNNVGGSCINPSGTTVPCSTATVGGGGLTDYTVSFKYDNLDEDLEMGLLYVKRIAAGSQDASAGILGMNGMTAGSNFNHWDIYGRKKLNQFTFAGEIPITTGDVSGVEYRTWAVALESKWDINRSWMVNGKVGHAPGQPDSETAVPGVFKGYSFNPNYKVGLIMFNYQFRNFAGPNTLHNPSTTANNLQSPFDNPITNANYLNLGGAFKTSKWTFRGNFVMAKADEAAGGSNFFYNTWTRSYQLKQANTGPQNSFLGWEMDYGTTFDWDENFQFNFDLGWWFPGGYYKFTNTPNETINLSPVFATVFQIGVVF